VPGALQNEKAREIMTPSKTTELMKNLKMLSKVDEQLAEVSAENQLLHKKIATLTDDINTHKNNIQDKLKYIKEETHKEHKNEILLKETENEIEKLTVQQNSAKTNEELQIFKKKKASLKVRMSELEDAVLAFLTDLDKSKEEVAEEETKFQAEEQRTNKMILELRQKIAECEQRQSEFLEKRKEVSLLLPADARSKYERVFAKEKRNAVVEVKNRICQGCFMKITLQELNCMWRGDDLVFCRNCNRILCLPDDELIDDG